MSPVPGEWAPASCKYSHHRPPSSDAILFSSPPTGMPPYNIAEMAHQSQADKQWPPKDFMVNALPVAFFPGLEWVSM